MPRALREDLAAHFESFVRDAWTHEEAGRHDAAWAHLEAAHIVGQRSTRLHVRAHLHMARLAWQQVELREWIGQWVRTVAAALSTWAWVPSGNTGRTSISPLACLEIPIDLAEIIAESTSASIGQRS